MPGQGGEMDGRGGGGVNGQGGLLSTPPPSWTRQDMVNGTHPTGMLSC